MSNKIDFDELSKRVKFYDGSERPSGNNADEWSIFLEHWAGSTSYIAVQIAAAIDRVSWQPIETLPNDEDLFVLATRVNDGAQMIWRASMLYRQMKGPTPHHLDFGATHWRHLPDGPEELKREG